MDILNSNSQNEQLKTILDDLKKGKNINDERLGNLTFNADTNNYDGKINWGGRNCSLHVAYRDEEFLKVNLKTAYYLLDNQKKIKEGLLKKILEHEFLVENFSYKIDKYLLEDEIETIDINTFKNMEYYYYYFEIKTKNILSDYIIQIDGTLDGLDEIKIYDPDTGDTL